MVTLASTTTVGPPPMNDLTRLCERIAERCRADGVPHPVAAALSLAVRGVAGVDPERWSEMVGLPLELVESCEMGRVPFGDLPPEIGDAADEAGLDLLALADLARAWGASAPPATDADGVAGPAIAALMAEPPSDPDAGDDGGVVGERPPGGT